MKKFRSLVSFVLIFAFVLTGCSTKNNNQDATDEVQQEETIENTSEDVAEDTTDTSNEDAVEPVETVTTRVASLKGPTSIGLVKLMEESDDQEAENQYEFSMYATADEIVTGIVKGDIDIALVPANVASVLYQKTDKGVSVIDINTLGVLSVVEHGDSIQSISDLKGKTICMTGKGTVPEYALNYLLEANGMTRDDVTVEFKSEPAEVVSFLASDETVIGILPQPFVTSATMQDDSLRVALNLTDEWNKLDADSTLITGVTIVRNEFLIENEEVVKTFLNEHAQSVDYVNNNVEDAATLVETYDIVKAAIAQNAIPSCNIVCIAGEEMKEKLSGYLETLFDQNEESVGGSLPDDAFYYEGVQE